MARRPLTENELKAAEKLYEAALKAKLLDKSLTQTEIAHRIGMTQSGVGHYLNGRIPLNLDSLFAICGVLNVNPARIFPELVSTKMFGDSEMLAEFISAYVMLDNKSREHFLELMKAQAEKVSSE